MNPILFLFALVQAQEVEEAYRLYQVGTNGTYCISVSPDTEGCISGTDQNGNPVNQLDVFKGKAVTFENLSDAPHDMKFTGANAEDVPAQAPKGDAVSKTMVIPDMNNQKITCSFHGDQLGLGYRVPEIPQQLAEMESGHRQRTFDSSSDFDNPLNVAFGAGAGSGGRKIVKTGLSDVTDFVAKSGPIEEVKRLLALRPDLGPSFAKARPDFAMKLMQEEKAAAMVALANKSITDPSILSVGPGGSGAIGNSIALGSDYGSNNGAPLKAKRRRVRVGDVEVDILPMDWGDNGQRAVTDSQGTTQSRTLASAMEAKAYPLGRIRTRDSHHGNRGTVAASAISNLQPIPKDRLRHWLWAMGLVSFFFFFLAGRRRRDAQSQRRTQYR